MTASEIIKPMLASAVTDYSKITWPKLVSPKLDGVRAIVNNGVVYSRSGKPIRSKVVQELFGKEEYNGLDGELIYGDPTAQDVFNKTTSFVMSENIPEGMIKERIAFHVFDKWNEQEGFLQRLYVVRYAVTGNNEDRVLYIPHVWCNNLVDMEEAERLYLSKGYEGIMLRNPAGLYKNGRATEKSQDLLKVKRFVDDEAEIVGFEELMHNTNEAKVNELGYQERSSSKDGLVGMNTLGALCCVTKEGIAFNIGTGFNVATRKEMWDNREALIGKLVKYKHFPIGVKDAPRLPVFLDCPEFIGIRHEDDVS